MNNNLPVPPAAPPQRGRVWLMGILVGVLAIGLLFGLGILFQNTGIYSSLLMPSFFLGPIIGGMVASV